MTEGLYQQFKDPTNLYRGKPFWSWNGKLDRNELLRQVHVMKEMGFGGFFMHSRTGLETEYLGEEWFELINACADEGAKLGMEAWLYDEDRWPSGTAGGMVTAEHRFRMRSLNMRIVQPNEFVWTDQTIAAFAASLDGLSLNQYREITPSDKESLRDDDKILVFNVVEMANSSFYNGNTYVDTLNKEATEAFLQSTHEKYKSHCGDRLGSSIKGIFTDEPHRGRMMSSFGSSQGEGDNDLNYSIPYTLAVFDEFEQAFGYDLKKRLPELFLWMKGEKVSQIKWHFVELIQRMFLDHFAKPIQQWCKDNNLILTGHILHEDSLTAQTAMSGSMMRYYEHMDYPGIDVLTESNNNYWLVKQLSSAARQLGQKWLLSELYGCTGWQLPFESHKSVGDWQALFGINLRCHHLSWYTMKGEGKRDYPGSILHQSTWWKEYRYVEDYFSRIGVVMSEGMPVCDTLVVNPVESVWCQVHPGWCNGLSAKAPEIRKLEEQYQKLFHWLTGAHIDFDYGDEEMMSRLAKVEQGRNGIPLLRVGRALYRQVVVAGMTTIRSTTLRLLKQFMEAGGKVVFAGDAPGYVDALSSSDALGLSSRATSIPFEQATIVSVCKAAASPWVSVLSPDGESDLTDIFVQVREDAGSLYIMMLNANRKTAYSDVKITVRKKGFIQEWQCSTGERYAIPANTGGDCLEFLTSFPPAGERLFVVTADRDESVPSKVSFHEKSRLTIENQFFAYELDEPNICVLDMARFRMDGGDWQPETEILKVDRHVRKSVGLPLRAGNMVQPWFARKSEFPVKGKVDLSFDFFIGEMPRGKVELVVEHPEHFCLKLNGVPVQSDKSGGWWVDICFSRILLDPEQLVIGKNTILMETEFHQGIDFEAIYLLGEFGVEVEGKQKTLTRLPERLTANDLTKQGFPFYSGKVTYKIPVPIQPLPEEKVFLELDGFAGACVLVNPESDHPGMIAWQPYEADITEQVQQGGELSVQVILTRRNTFGPLHQTTLYTRHYGPGNFVAEGAAFTEEYRLVPTGLLTPPVIRIQSIKGSERLEVAKA